MKTLETLTFREFWNRYGRSTLESQYGILNERERVAARPVARLSNQLLAAGRCCHLFPQLADRIEVDFRVGDLAESDNLNFFGQVVEADRIPELYPADPPRADTSLRLDGQPLTVLAFDALHQRLQMIAEPEEAVARTVEQLARYGC